MHVSVSIDAGRHEALIIHAALHRILRDVDRHAAATDSIGKRHNGRAPYQVTTPRPPGIAATPDRPGDGSDSRHEAGDN